MNKKFSLFISLIFSIFLIKQSYAAVITDCTNITTSGDYYLVNDINGSSYEKCIVINASNVVLDCQGYTITSGTYGIAIYGSYITIKNCILKGGNHHIYSFTYAQNIEVINNSFYGPTFYAVALSSINKGSKNLYVYNNRIYCNSSKCGWGGISLVNSSNVTVTNNYIENQTSGMTDGGLLVGLSRDVRITYNTFNSVYIGISIPASRYVVISDNVVRGSSYVGIGILTSDDSIIEDNTISGNNVGIGITDYNGGLNSSDVNVTNVTIRNNKIEGNTYGLQESLMLGTGYFFDIYIYNNLFNQTTNTYIQNPDRFSGYWNTTRQTGTRIYSAGTEIGGNYWTNPSGNGYSDTCTDADNDGFCDNSYTVATNNIDYLPYSNKYVAPAPPAPAGGRTSLPISFEIQPSKFNITVGVGEETFAELTIYNKEPIPITVQIEFKGKKEIVSTTLDTVNVKPNSKATIFLKIKGDSAPTVREAFIIVEARKGLASNIKEIPLYVYTVESETKEFGQLPVDSSQQYINIAIALIVVGGLILIFGRKK